MPEYMKNNVVRDSKHTQRLMFYKASMTAMAPSGRQAVEVRQVLGACASAARPESIRSSSIATPPGAIVGAHGEEHELRVAAMAI